MSNTCSRPQGTDPARNADLAKIHLAKKTLGMTDEDYRTMLQAQTGHSSASKLNHAQRLKVLAHMQTMGFRPKAGKAPRRPKRPTPAADRLPLVRRIRAQLISLDRKPDEYADGIARKMFGGQIQFFEWCTPEQLHSISAALAYEQRRRGAATG